MKRIHLFFIISALGVNSLTGAFRSVSLGVSAGIGFPKIPYSQFNTPVSVLGNGMVHFSFLGKWGIQADGNALTTFSLGKVNQAQGDLQFDVYWGSLALTYKMTGFMRNRSALIAGVGKYYLTQQISRGTEKIQTAGMNLGLSNWMIGPKWRGYFEVRWHLLFKPSENPQILTLTYGWLF
jgi:hypothetical protein